MDKKTAKIPLNQGVRQGDTSSPKLITLALDDIFKKLDWVQKGLNMDGRFLNHLSFVDDLLIISSNLKQLKAILIIIMTSPGEVGLTMNFRKINVNTPVHATLWTHSG